MTLFPDVPGSAELASIGQRVGARLIDWILLFMSSFMILVFGDSRVGYLVWMAVVAAYEAGFVSRTGQTVGKRILGIAVVDHRTGAIPTLRSALVRVAPILAVMAIIPGTFFPAVLVFIYFSAAFSQEDYRGLLDRIAKTAVIKVAQ